MDIPAITSGRNGKWPQLLYNNSARFNLKNFKMNIISMLLCTFSQKTGFSGHFSARFKIGYID